MGVVKRRAIRLLLRSYRSAQESVVRETQIILIVLLAILVWMTWGMLTFGKLPAFILTLPTSLPALAWLDRQQAWIDRRDQREPLRRRTGRGESP